MAVSASLISVIVPCYNQAEYLAEALDSVFNQTYTTWECFIVNDGATDHTESIAKRYIEKDARFKYLERKNGGLSSARNAGIKKASGIYILPLDADDKIGIEYMEKAVQILDSNSDVKVVYAHAEFFGKMSGRWILGDFSLKSLALSNMIFCTAFFRKVDYENAGGYDETLIYGYEDWDLWLSILSGGGKVIQLPGVYFYYRKKESSMLEMLGSNGQQQIETKKKIYLKHINFFTDLFGDPISAFYAKTCVDGMKTQIDSLYKSKSYRIGNFLVKYIFLKWKI